MTGSARIAVVALVLAFASVAHAADELGVVVALAYVAPARGGLAFEARRDIATGFALHAFVRGDAGTSGFAGVGRAGLTYAYDVVTLVPLVQLDAGLAFDAAAVAPSYGVGVGLRHYVSLHAAVDVVGGCEWIDTAPRFVLRVGVAFD